MMEVDSQLIIVTFFNLPLEYTRSGINNLRHRLQFVDREDSLEDIYSQIF